MDEPILQIRDLHKRFRKLQVLRGVNLDIRTGETTTIIGKSGTGKSVLLKHLICLLEPDRGRVLFQGQDLRKMKRRELLAYRRRFSYMFQHMALFDSLSVYDNVAMPLRETLRLKPPAVRERVYEMLAEVELEEFAHSFPGELSGGMQKRVALARALVTHPEIVLFDEPTTGLDPIRKASVHSLIAETQKSFGFTAIIVSHDIPDVFDVSDTVAMLEQGRVIATGPPAQIEAAKDSRVRSFLQGIASEESAKWEAEAHIGDTIVLERSGGLNSNMTVLALTLERRQAVQESTAGQVGRLLLCGLRQVVQAHFPEALSCRYSRQTLLVFLPGRGSDESFEQCQAMAGNLEPGALGADYAGGPLELTLRGGVAAAEHCVELNQMIHLALARQVTMRKLSLPGKASA